MTDESLKILYVGPDYLGSNGTCWRDALVQLGHKVFTLDSERILQYPTTLLGKAWSRLRRRPTSSSIRALNDNVVRRVVEIRPHLTFYIQARFIFPETLERTRALGLNCAYMNDDMFNSANQTFTFFSCLPSIDYIFSTKSYNVSEFLKAGAPNAAYVPNAFDPAIHYPAQPSLAELHRYAGDMAFIGTFRPERADYLASLCESMAGKAVMRIWGGGWHKMQRPIYWRRRHRWRSLDDRVECRELWGPEMGKAIQSNKVSLGLLNHANRDLHTSRTFEIPACGGFMLAERTGEHLEFFEEDREAVYFSSIDELKAKLHFYLKADSARVRIARAGFERCIKSGYQYTDRARAVLSLLRPSLGRKASTA